MKKLYIVKIILFLFIILIPVVGINYKSNQVSEIDNRMLIDASDILSSGDITENMESYINDRIGFRNKMVSLYTKGMDILFDEMVHPIYQYGKDGYIFPKVSTMTLNKEFNEVYSDFIADFQKYCNDRNIDFVYAIEPSKATIYTEYLPEGYVYNTESVDYFISLLKEKEVNFVNNIEVLLAAKEYAQVFDPMFDAGHWNETGAIIGISAILDRINVLDPRVEKLDINNFEAKDYVNTKLPSSDFSINETTTRYSLIEDNSDYIEDYEDEIIRSEQFPGYSHYKNNNKIDGPRILVFSGSYFNNKEKFFTENFSEVMKIHNYHNVINYDYYIDIFKPDIVLFESTEYTHTDYYFPIKGMIDTINND
ncbi:alginate O-acetyltransferase [Clostridium sp. AL.422]|uniref:alginate O-acetyltransferase AlgX-related protein n=1 Tax=Clostridium TaxID=1485 RepID=UPI00293DE943|nr:MULTISPECIES: alginate O-acetyltransferase [unclassified Clostridium]MDV4150378.1 alginate O-acetyltransferase [Clostridium sp. AL.422]